jgi:hypothetical protein
MGHGRPDSPRHYFIEHGCGAVAHELGHALGLSHDTRQDARHHGQGFRRIRWNFADPPQPANGGAFSEENIRVLLSSRFLAAGLVSDPRSARSRDRRCQDADNTVCFGFCRRCGAGGLPAHPDQPHARRLRSAWHADPRHLAREGQSFCRTQKRER